MHLRLPPSFIINHGAGVVSLTYCAPPPPPPSLPAFNPLIGFHTQVPVQSWFDDMTDTELLDLLPLLEGLSKEEDVYGQLQSLRDR